MKKTFPRWAVALFFAAFLLLGLATAAHYGPAWDEMDEMDILRMNLWEYARAFGMDESAFERRAAQEDALTISKLTPISQSIEQDHGIAAFYPLAGVVMSESLSGAQRSALWHMGCWAVFTLGAYALYCVCRQLGLGRVWALLGPALLLVSPRFFAQGHYNNKDIALLSLALCLLWQAIRLMKKPAFSTALWFSFFGALAANTKVAGVALWGLCALVVLIRQIAVQNLKGRVWAVAGVAAASFIAFYALLTPALWADPAAFVRYLVSNALAFQRWNGYVLLRGTVFFTLETSLPWYYLPYMIVVTTPIWVLALIAGGCIAAAVRCARTLRRDVDGALALLLTLLMWLLPLGFAILTRTRVYNDWRHFYFAYGPMLALAAWGLHALRGRIRRVAAAVTAVCLLAGGAGIALQHPYQYAYYQPLAAMRGENYNELDYWNVSMRDALEQLAQQTHGEIALVPVDLWTENGLAKALSTMSPQTAARFLSTEKIQQMEYYLLVNPTYAVIGGFTPTENMEEAVTITAYGQPIMRIYRITQKEAELP